MFHAPEITFKLFVCELFRGCFKNVSLFFCFFLNCSCILLVYRNLDIER